MSAEKTVFISYRREPASFIARAIYLDLRQRGYDVFMDVESIDNGTFDTIILNQIAARQHFLVILTPGTLEGCNEDGDWMRREIEYALEKQRNIVPVLMNDFKFANYTQYLTDKLAELPRYNGVDVPHNYFDAAMDRLCTRFLIKPMQGRIELTPAQEQQIIDEKQAEADSQVVPTETELTAEDYFARALSHIENKRFHEALEDCNEAIRLSPNFARAYSRRGVIFNELKDYDRAIADYNEAIRLNPQLERPYLNRGNTLKT